MKSRYEQRVQAENAAARAAQRAAPPPAPPLPDAAVIGERCAVHGTDSGVEERKRIAADLADVVKHVGALRRNPTMNDAQKLLGVDDLVRGRIERLHAEVEEQGRVIDTLERGVEQAIEDAFHAPRAEWHALGTEFRNALLDMDDEQRLDFIERLQGTRHAALLRWAIGSVPAELSGVSAGVHKQMHDTVLAIKDPTLLTRPGDLRRRRTALKQLQDGINRTAAELVDGEQAAALRALVSGGDA